MLLERFKEDILSGLTLARPEPYRSLYLKTYWYKDGMGEVIM